MIILLILILIGATVPWVLPEPLWKIVYVFTILLYITMVVLIVIHQRTGILSSIDKYISVSF
tara:strand:+ start:1242 stop:1427 length:186 start_codon:yes stop_codon:yes gene_type:complete